jgi:hypothetical protein
MRGEEKREARSVVASWQEIRPELPQFPERKKLKGRTPLSI